MLLTLKNKTCLAMDALIREAKEKGGVPANFKMNTQEASDFLIELTELDAEARKNIIIKQDETEPDARFLLKRPLTKTLGNLLLNKWNKKEIVILYKNVEVIIFNKKPAIASVPGLPPPPPLGPPARIIKDGDAREKCVICGSSMKRKLLLWTDGCMQPQCKNYYLNTQDADY